MSDQTPHEETEGERLSRTLLGQDAARKVEGLDLSIPDERATWAARVSGAVIITELEDGRWVGVLASSPETGGPVEPLGGLFITVGPDPGEISDVWFYKSFDEARVAFYNWHIPDATEPAGYYAHHPEQTNG